MSLKNISNEKKITLMVSKEEASEKIKNRIELGKKMLESPVNNEEEIEDLKNNKARWSDFNVELLKGLFSNDSISKEYQSTSGAGRVVPYDPYGGGMAWGVMVENLENDLNAKINKLKSIFERLEFYSEKSINQFDKLGKLNAFWGLLHPKIVKVSKNRFEAKHFADSVEAAFKEINKIVKSIVKQRTNKEFDGSDLMNRAFSPKNPIIALDDLSTQSGQDAQKGYMQIFSGSMTGIRNPKAHENVTIERQRTIHFLFLASLLMFKIDEKK
jgi:uncharacterized protein (TIGR02391 family)